VKRLLYTTIIKCIKLLDRIYILFYERNEFDPGSE